MSEFSNYGDTLVFAAFLSRIHQLGFTVGVGHYLRLHELISKVGDCAPSQLKTLLCPLFATSHSQQEQFYRTFDEYFEIFQRTELQAECEDPKAVVERSRQKLAAEMKTATGRRRLSLSLARLAERLWVQPLQFVDVVVLLVILGLSIICASTYLRAHSELASAIARNKSAKDNIDNLTLKVESLEQELSELRLDTGAVELLAEKRFGFVRPSNRTENIPKRYVLSGVGLSTFDQLLADTPEGDSAPLDAPRESFYRRHFDLINLATILSPLIFFLVLELHYLNKRLLIVRSQSGKRPPYAWPIVVEPKAPDLWDTERFYTAARLMRRRQVAESSQLDLDATVAATIEMLGYPSLRFKPDSEQPEYIVLIERLSFRDHQSRLFNDLVKKLEMEGVLVQRYYYDGDLRICSNEDGNSIYLADLWKHLYRHRLIIYGSGEDLVDPITGRMLPWTVIFSDWQGRALLTPKLPSTWGINEFSLASDFTLVPATLNGLLAVIDRLDSTMTSSFHEGQERFELPPMGLDHNTLVKGLRDYLGDESFRWLCSCAIYPEIQWSLTLYLATLPHMKAGFANEKNALRLFSLPWFRKGSIPGEIRSALIGELDEESARTIRSAIIQLLERNAPPHGSFASDDYRLNLSVQRWLVAPNRRRRREMFKVIRSVPHSRVLHDYALLRSLESAEQSPLSLLLPRRAQTILYKKGIRAFGLRSLVRSGIAILLMFAAASIMRPLSNRPLPVERRATVIARHESWPIEWLDDNAVPMAIDLKTGSGGYIPPIVTGFSRTKDPAGDEIINLERLDIYKTMQRALDRGPNPRWNSIDEIDLTYTNNVIVSLIDPAITVHIGNSHFRRRLETALLILDAIRRKDSQFFGPFHLEKPNAFLSNSIDFMSIDVSHPEQVVIDFYAPKKDQSVLNDRRRQSS